MTPPALTVIWDERFRAYDFGAGHPFQMSSRGLAARLLETTVPDDGTVAWVRDVPPTPATELATFHTPEYLRLVERSSSARHPVFLDTGDTPAFPGCWEASARVVGGTRRGIELAREGNAPVLQPGGGLHHAHPDRASGFCIFNDVALGIRHALDAGDRVAYIDIDAHHGDGVMYGFFDTGRLLDIDFHQDGRTLFPGTGFPSETGQGDPPEERDEGLVAGARRQGQVHLHPLPVTLPRLAGESGPRE